MCGHLRKLWVSWDLITGRKMPQYRMISYHTIQIALYPRKHNEQWICEYIIELEEPVGMKGKRGSANGIFHSLTEAEDAAIKEAKHWIDCHFL